MRGAISSEAARCDLGDELSLEVRPVVVWKVVAPSRDLP